MAGNTNVIGPCPRCGNRAQLRIGREVSLAGSPDSETFSVLHVEKVEHCPDYDEPYSGQI